MPQGAISIGEAELEIMKVLWKADTPLNSHDIVRAVEHRGWKRTTISTFLTRLVDKGALASEKQGNSYLYTPRITAKEYKRSQVKSLIRNLFDGSAHDLAVSLFKDEQFSDEDIRELRAMFDEREE